MAAVWDVDSGRHLGELTGRSSTWLLAEQLSRRHDELDFDSGADGRGYTGEAFEDEVGMTWCWVRPSADPSATIRMASGRVDGLDHHTVLQTLGSVVVEPEPLIQAPGAVVEE